MSALRNVTQGFRNLWGAADEYDESLEPETAPTPRESYTPSTRARDERLRDERPEQSAEGEQRRNSGQDRPQDRPERVERFTAPAISTSASTPTSAGSNHGGGDLTGRRLRSVAMPSRASREKNIYTLKPKSLEESCMAADYLKTGCAVVLNLEAVEPLVAIRIIDFMSGVCYGLEHQGHAMKLGEKIFLFTPGDFEIASDEIDYAENRDLIFKDVAPQPALEAPVSATVSTPISPLNSASTSISTPASAAVSAAERRSWER